MEIGPYGKAFKERGADIIILVICTKVFELQKIMIEGFSLFVNNAVNVESELLTETFAHEQQSFYRRCCKVV